VRSSACYSMPAYASAPDRLPGAVDDQSTKQIQGNVAASSSRFTPAHTEAISGSGLQAPAQGPAKVPSSSSADNQREQESLPDATEDPSSKQTQTDDAASSRCFTPAQQPNGPTSGSGTDSPAQESAEVPSLSS